MASKKVKAGKLIVSLVLVGSVAVMLSIPLDIIPPLGNLIDPFHGIWTVPLTANHPPYLEVHAPGQLDAQVTVIRDSWGVPHIYAENNHDLYFAFGYVQAQDRLWQMDMARRQGRGWLAEILGPDYLEADLYLRTIGMEAAAEVTLNQMLLETDAENQTIINDLSAFTDGVNFFISTVGSNLPLEFKLLNYQPAPWALIDSIVVGRVMAYGLTWSDSDLRFAKTVDALGNDSAWELFPLVPPLQIPVVPENGTNLPPPPNAHSPASETGIDNRLSPVLMSAINDVLGWQDRIKDPLGILIDQGDPGLGSNNWAVNGSKSATGSPILLNDMHLQWSVPSVWYQAHLVSADSGLNVYGFHLPGVPLTIVGHNEFLAWGFTNTGFDVLDWYYYKMHPTNPNKYWYDGSWHTIEQETIYINVKDVGVVPEVIQRTVHGPILSRHGYTVAQRWTGQDASFELRALYKMNHATDYAEFTEGQREFWTPAQNIVYADVDGNIAIRPTGRIPIRESYPFGRLPLNGSAGEGEWTSFVPFDDLPLSLNPSWGYVASANQLGALYGTAPGNYEYYLHSLVAPGYRARRIHYLLSNDDDITVDDMKRIQNDVVDNASSVFVPYIISAFDSASPAITDSALNAAVDYLRTWNYSMLTDLVAPTIWRGFWDYYEDAIFGDEYDAAASSNLLWPSPVITENLTLYNPSSHWFNDVTTATTETRDDIIIKALNASVIELQAKKGLDMSAWTWGSVHFVQFTHLAGISALGHGPYPADGDIVTINPSGCNMWADSPEEGAAKGGASERLIVDLSDTLHALSAIPGGQSGNPCSTHYSDQLHQLFLVGDYHTDYLYPNIDDLTDRESMLVLLG
jgi:penicillin amidase